MADLSYEIGYPDGNWVRIYLDGRAEGVPDGTSVGFTRNLIGPPASHWRGTNGRQIGCQFK